LSSDELSAFLEGLREVMAESDPEAIRVALKRIPSEFQRALGRVAG
jgi:hypothetical protein